MKHGISIFAPLRHCWGTGTRAQKGHERCTRSAREVHLWALKGHGIFHFYTFRTRLHRSCTRGALEGHERGTRGAREGH